MIRFKRLSMSEAKAIVSTYDQMSDIEFDDLVNHWKQYDVPTEQYDDSYDEFRTKLVDSFKAALIETNGKMTYLLDLRVGIALYQLLPIGDDFTVVMANDDDIWRYISVRVMPDITYLRYPDPEKGSVRINQKRFYSHTRRIWLKTLWWYIHLSWQGNAEDTFEVLKNNGTNIISHFIERPGRGYRLKLFREMMYVYSKQPGQKDKLFRAAAKLNRARCVNVEPALTFGGERKYAEILFDEVSVQGEIEDAE